MPKISAAPGVYLEDVEKKPKPEFLTGVPAFLGYDDAPGAGGIDSLDASAWSRRYASRSFPGYLGVALSGFFENGGRRCHVVPLDPAGGAAGFLEGLAALDAIDGFDLICAPDLASSSVAVLTQCQAAILELCASKGGCFAILDAAKSSGAGADQDIADVRAQRALLETALLTRGAGMNGALYFPWVLVRGAASDSLAPPCGHVAGVYARGDQSVGVHKPPANEELSGVLDLESRVGAATQELLNPEGINTLRAFPGRGMRIWGARTLSRDPAWLYVNVRRTVLTLGRWIEQNMTGLVFEPNNARLWVRIHRELNAFLGKMWDQGALKGASAEEAFFVQCDGDNNPKEARDAGRVVIDVGVAPVTPGEFIVVRVTRGSEGFDASGPG